MHRDRLWGNYWVAALVIIGILTWCPCLYACGYVGWVASNCMTRTKEDFPPPYPGSILVTQYDTNLLMGDTFERGYVTDAPAQAVVDFYADQGSCSTDDPSYFAVCKLPRWHTITISEFDAGTPDAITSYHIVGKWYCRKID